MKSRKTLYKTLGVCLLVFVVLAGIKTFSVYRAIKAHSFSPPPEAVTSVNAKSDSWRSSFTAVGTLISAEGATLSADEPGTVSRVAFESGATVKQGDLLIEIDPSVEEAQLKGAIALADRTSKGLERAQKLRSTNAVSADELDNAVSLFQRAQSDVQSLRAKIAKKKITAPFSGRAGIRTVNVGDHVSAGDPIVPLHNLEKLYVNFSLPQQSIGKISSGQEVELNIDSYPNEKFVGKINAINPNVSDTSRNVAIQAVIANHEEKLRPGMFVEVTIWSDESHTIVALPVTSINYAPYGDSVFIIEKITSPEKGEYQGVRQQFVKLGTKRGDQVAVLSGVKENDEVVTSGLFKLRQGAAVVVNNKFAPSSELAPSPQDT